MSPLTLISLVAASFLFYVGVIHSLFVCFIALNINLKSHNHWLRLENSWISTYLLE